MHISDDGVALIASFEGFSSRPYWDRWGKVWTRGYGETEGITAASPAISPAQGLARLRELVQANYEPAIRVLGVDFTQNQWDALCSFAWNLGSGIFTGSLRAELLARDFTAAGERMLAYDHAGGVVLEGLALRRRAEVALFLKTALPYVPADERRWISEYDALRDRRGPWAAVRRRALRRRMLARRRLIRRLATPLGPHGWQELNRRARYEALLARTE